MTDRTLTSDEVSEFRRRFEEALGSENFDRLGARILPPGAPPPGKFRVTIRIERPDAQFVTSSRLIPGDLLTDPGPDSSQITPVMEDILGAFVSAYHRAAELADLA